MISKHTFKKIIVLTLLICVSCSLKESKFKNDSEFKEKKDDQIKLPDDLKEISGLDMISKNVCIAINDEDGIVYFYDIEKREITRSLKFAEKGDYEGIALVNSDIYVLRSDSRLYHIQNYEEEEPTIIQYDLNLPADDNESMCFDEKRNILYLAPKGQFEHDKHKNSRPIFEFSIETKKVKKIPIINIDLDEVKDKTKDLDLSKESDFWITDICKHPTEDIIYLITSKAYLVSLDLDGKILGIQQLDKDRLPQPEGIIFNGNKELIICSEGDKNHKGILNFYTLENK